MAQVKAAQETVERFGRIDLLADVTVRGSMRARGVVQTPAPAHRGKTLATPLKVEPLPP